MPIPSGPEHDELVYRRVTPKHWHDRNGIVTIDPAAFLPNRGLSVFNAAMVSNPRYVLQDYINKTLAKLDDPLVSEESKQKIQRRLESGTFTVEELYRRERWRIVELPISAFPLDEFTFGPLEEDGHQNILGSDESFQTYAVEWASIARMLTEHECLQH